MDNERWDYKRIKKEARQRGGTIEDLCALAPKNDPFYVGTPAQRAKAQWFADLWEQYEYSTGVHLRRVHYQVDAQDPAVLWPDGKPYENTENNWKYLCDAGKWARYLELVPYNAFVDRHNPEAKVNARWSVALEPFYSVFGEWDGYRYTLPNLPELPNLPAALPALFVFDVGGYDAVQQSYHVEVWCEKTTMNDILVPLCRRYGVNLVTGAGEMSITSVVLFMERAWRANGRPARILYVSDFDAAGTGMPISVSRKIEYFQRENGYDYLDIRLQPVALTADQVIEYDLPRKPGKESDARLSGWEATHGKGIVELDALEALRPGSLRETVTDAILGYYDPELQDKSTDVEKELTDALDDKRDSIIYFYQDEIDELKTDYAALLKDFGGTREEFNQLVADFQPELDAYTKRLGDIKKRGRELYGRIEDAFAGVDLDLAEYALPEPDLPDENDGVVYVSGRDYLAQLDAYAVQRHGTNGTR